MASANPPLSRSEEIKCFVGAGLSALVLAGLVIGICFLIAEKI